MPEQSVQALSDIDLSLGERLKDLEFRREWFRAELEDTVPSSFKALRERRKLTQAGLATLVGTKQSGISRFEQSDEAVWEFAFLLRMAEAMDARLKVTVEAAEDVIREYLDDPSDSETPDIGSFDWDPPKQVDVGSSVLQNLRGLNEAGQRRGGSGDLLNNPKTDKGRALFGRSSPWSDQALQFSELSREAASEL